MRKLVRQLERAFPEAKVETTRGGHIKIKLPNGTIVFTSSTPSDRRTMLNVRGEVRRAMGRSNDGGTRSIFDGAFTAEQEGYENDGS